MLGLLEDEILEFDDLKLGDLEAPDVSISIRSLRIVTRIRIAKAISLTKLARRLVLDTIVL